MTDWRILNKGFHIEYLELVESGFANLVTKLLDRRL